MADSGAEHLPPPPGADVWNELTLSDLRVQPKRLLANGMAITGVGGFGELDVIEDRAVATIGAEIMQRRGFTGSRDTTLQLRGMDLRLSSTWRPRRFEGPIEHGVAYVLSFDNEVAGNFGLRGGWEADVLCLPILFVGVLRSRSERLAGFAGSALYYPRRVGNRSARSIGFPISRIDQKPLSADEIESLVAESAEESEEIGRRLAALAMRRPYSGGSMSGGKRS